MNKYYFTLILFCISTLSFAQKTNEYDFSGFDAISIGIPANVTITKGNNYKVIIEADEDDLEDIEVGVSGNRLRIKHENSFNFWGDMFDDKVEIRITMPELTGVSLAGSGKVTSKDKFTTDEFEAEVAGSGKLEVYIDAKEAELDISGSGKIILTGSAGEAEINISGSGDIEAEDFKIGNCDINIMGSGDCNIYVTERLDTRIMGSGDVTYKGDPKYVNNNSMGSGRVKKL